MKRQQVRFWLIVASLVIFPITLNYFSPYLIIDGAIAGVASGSMVTFAAMFLTSLFLGRGFCGWACPGAGIQELLMKVRKKPVRTGKADWIKYIVVWIPWMAGIITAAVVAGGITGIDFFRKTEHIISVTSLPNLIMLLMVSGLIAVIALIFGRRAFCHYACWMSPFMIIGTKAGRATRIPSLHLEADSARCTDCKTCTKQCPMSLDVNGLVSSGSMYHSECILCGTCVDNCPKNVICYKFGRAA